MNTHNLLNTRFEVKYAVSEAVAQNVLNEISGFLQPDAYSQDGAYEVRSLYYDTLGLKHVHSVLNGEPSRLKVRYRNYSCGSPSGFMELKRRVRGKILKRRLQCSLDDVNHFIARRFDRSSLPQGDEWEFELTRDQLAPTVSITYRREAFIDRFGQNIRLTVDRQIRCGNPESFFRPTTYHDFRVLPVGTCVVELKFDRALPYWISRVIRRLGISPSSYSKYIKSVARVRGNQLFVGVRNG